MMCITEDPTRHFLRSPPLIFELSKLGEGNMFSAGQFVVPPLDLWQAAILATVERIGMEYVMDHAEAVRRRQAFEVGLDRERLDVPSAHVLENT